MHEPDNTSCSCSLRLLLLLLLLTCRSVCPPLLLLLVALLPPLLLLSANAARLSQVAWSPKLTAARYSLYKVASFNALLRRLNILNVLSLASAAAPQLLTGLRVLLLSGLVDSRGLAVPGETGWDRRL